MIIQVCDLSYNYPNSEKQAVSGLNFTVEKGEIFGFLGPSGAGKTTTQKILIGSLSDYQGQVNILGKDLSAWGRDYYEYHFNKLTALENLNYFAALYDREVLKPEKLLKELGLLESAKERVESFSKGMKNRLSLARALLHSPKLLFLDEPTAGLDPVNTRKIKDLILEKRAEGATIFLTTHDMSVAAELADRVSFIVDGQIAVIDNPHQLELKYGQSVVGVEYWKNDLRIIWRDDLLSWMIGMPLGLGLLLRWGFPYVLQALGEYLGADLMAHYSMLSGFFILLIVPMVSGLIVGFLLLDQRDNRILTVLRVTPISTVTYLLYASIMPLISSLLITVISFYISGLGSLGRTVILTAALSQAPLVAITMVSFAENKLQGFALVKASIVFWIPPIFAYFIRPDWEYLFGIIPLYWPCRIF